LLCFPKKRYTLAGFEPGSAVSEADAMSTAPRRQGMDAILRLNKWHRDLSFVRKLRPELIRKIFFQLSPPVKLTSLRFVSGNVEHPSDRFLDTTVEVLFKDAEPR
jgi:hypothetical protein